MRKAARLLIRALRGFLLVFAAISAIAAFTLAIYGEFLPEVLGWFQAAVAAAAYAFAIGLMVPERGSGPRNIGKARKVLLALLLFEIATSVCAFVIYLALNQSLPITGLAFTSGFPNNPPLQNVGFGRIASPLTSSYSFLTSPICENLGHHVARTEVATAFRSLPTRPFTLPMWYSQPTLCKGGLFPNWDAVFGVDSAGAGVYLDIPLLVMVVFLYTLDKDALDDRADDAA